MGPLLFVFVACVVAGGDPLFLLDPSSGGLCLDGTPGGFYLSRNTSSTKWVLFFQGGGWCYDLDECASIIDVQKECVMVYFLLSGVDRSKTDLGSSSKWPQTRKDGEAPGLFSSDPNVNPFASFNKVKLFCCLSRWTI